MLRARSLCGFHGFGRLTVFEGDILNWVGNKVARDKVRKAL